MKDTEPRAEPTRTRRLVAIGVAVLLYACYAPFAWWAETAARLHCRVPSRAEVASITERVPHVRAESARDRALAEMKDWRPYAIWSVVVSVLLIAAMAASIVAGVMLAIATARGSGVASIKLAAVGIVLLVALSIGAIAGPPLAAEASYERRATNFAPVQ